MCVHVSRVRLGLLVHKEYKAPPALQDPRETQDRMVTKVPQVTQGILVHKVIQVLMEIRDLSDKWGLQVKMEQT